MQIRIILVPALAGALMAGAAKADICVSNATAETYLFVAEARGGGREVRRLAPDERLCAKGDQSASGVVSVFEDADSDEGCSRLVEAAGSDTLLRYVSFDRCQWASHER